MADSYQIRMVAPDDDDVRAGAVLGAGRFDAETATVPIPILRPFAEVTFVAEVRGAHEPGIDPMPGRWSRPSSPLAYVEVPPMRQAS